MRTVKLTDSISSHFTWHDALWLPKWNRAACEQDGLDSWHLDTLEWFFKERVEPTRLFIGLPFVVHVCCRPDAYNKLVGGKEDSAHRIPSVKVAAIDFHVKGITCDDVRIKLTPELSKFQVRVEDRPGSDWVHMDSKIPPNGHWLFKP